MMIAPNSIMIPIKKRTKFPGRKAHSWLIKQTQQQVEDTENKLYYNAQTKISSRSFYVIDCSSVFLLFFMFDINFLFISLVQMDQMKFMGPYYDQFVSI